MSLGEVFGELVALLVFLVGSAFFSASETALLSLPKAKLARLGEAGPAGRLILRVTRRPDRLLGAILLGNNLVNIAGSVAGTSLCLALWPESGLIVATAGLTVIFLVLGEITPKTLAAYRPARVSLWLIRPLHLFILASQPVVGALTAVSRGILGLLGQSPDPQRKSMTREDLLTLVAMGRREGYLDPHEQDMLRGILELNQITVAEVMQPLPRAVTLDAAMSVREAEALAIGTSFSRFPVVAGAMEKVLGYVHLRDLAAAAPSRTVGDIVHHAVFVPSSRSVREQLLDFRQRRDHMAFVVDEFGRILGLVTLEDVLEEIVGEILDEYDIKTAPLKRAEDGGFLADGRLTVREFNRLTGLALPLGPYRTISGLLQTLAQKIPATGEVFSWENLRLRVERMDGRAVGRAKIWAEKA